MHLSLTRDAGERGPGPGVGRQAAGVHSAEEAGPGQPSPKTHPSNPRPPDATPSLLPDRPVGKGPVSQPGPEPHEHLVSCQHGTRLSEEPKLLKQRQMPPSKIDRSNPRADAHTVHFWTSDLTSLASTFAPAIKWEADLLRASGTTGRQAPWKYTDVAPPGSFLCRMHYLQDF